MGNRQPDSVPAPGARETLRKTMTVAEQALYTGISGHLGKLHVNRAYARDAAGLADMAVFELAMVSLLTTCMARLAGPEYRIAELGVRLHRAVPIDTTVEAEARLARREPDRLAFDLTCRDGGEIILAGHAVLVPVRERLGDPHGA